MFELTIILSSLGTLILSAYLYQYASGEPVWRLNMLTYSFWFLAAWSFVCSVVVVLDIPFLEYAPEYSEHIYGDRAHRIAVWAIVLWMFIGIPLGAILANLFYRTRSFRKLVANYRASDIQIGWHLSEKSLFRLVLIASGALALMVLYQQPETTALSNIIATGDVVGSQVIRRQTIEGTGNVLFDSMFNQGTLQWLSYIAFAMVVVTGRWKWRLLFGVLFAIMVFLGLSIGSPSHILYYLLGIGFIRSFLGRRFIKTYEFVAVAALLSILFITFKGAEGNIITVLLYPVASRILFGQLVGTYKALDYFSSQHEFIGFASTGKVIHEMLGAHSLESYGLIMMNIYNPVGVAAGSAGHLTTIFMGEAWANFGVIGIIIAPLWVGAVVQLVNRAFIIRRKSVIAVAFYAYIAITFGYISDFIGFYYPLGTVLFLLGAISILMMGRLFLTKPANRRRSVISNNFIQNRP